MTDDRIYWIWLAEQTGAGSSLGVKLINRFGSARHVFEAEIGEDTEFPGFNKREIERTKRILGERSTEKAEKILKEAEEAGQRVIVPTDGDFPLSLKNLRDAPLVLYAAGRLPRFNSDLFVSAVGSRKMSDYGRDSAYALGYGLASGGACVVSGMALGVDSVAMTGALEAGGVTVAVLGSGVDVVYPREHGDLYRAVLRDGCVMSEYPPGTEPSGFRFPIRNRIISGLSVATVVVEADAGSGSLITARHAAYQGRAVFAVPGRVGTPGSYGTNGLLKNGALVATSAEDILAEYEFTFPHSVSLGACRNALRGVDVSEAAEEAVNRMRVGSRGSGNYYGKGTYGGKKLPSAPRRKNGKPQGETVRMGDLSDDLPAGFVRVGRKTEPQEPQRIDLDMLDEVNIRVYNLMTPDVPVTADELVRPDLPVSEVLSSMSALELAGAIEAGAGGYYLRRGSDDLGADGVGE